MANVGKSTSRVNKRETRPRSSSEKKPVRGCEEISPSSSSSSCVGEEDHSPALNGHDIQSLAITAQDLERLRVPKPPADSQKPKSMTRVFVRKTRPPDEVGRMVRVAVAKPLPQDVAPPLPFEYAGPGGPRFDTQGMVLPHSILGSLEEFRTEMQLRGETELVQRTPDGQTPPPLMEPESDSGSAEGHSESGRGHQSHALQHWFRHMTERRRQQDFISQTLHSGPNVRPDVQQHLLHKQSCSPALLWSPLVSTHGLLQKPPGCLLMNRSSRFRRVQEQRELIGRGPSALHTGHGRRAGSEFWRVPQRYGDETSGITATLTQTERGNPPDTTRIAQPLGTRLQSGDVLADAVNSGWDHSLYLQRRRRELKDVLRDFSPPDAEGLEVLGSGLTVTRSPLLDDREEDEDEEQKENEDPLALFDDIITDVDLSPTLRVCGEAVCWTGSTSSHQGQEGVSVRLMFEEVTGQSVNTDLELKNEGSTVIYYSWERLTPTHTLTQHFYFNNTTAVILPSSTKRISFTFKSAAAGIITEVWRLNTHPVLMGGASVHVTLRGVALEQDRSAHQRAALQKQLEQKASVSMCRRIIVDLLTGVRSPERPSSPDDLYITDEELFHMNNPDLQYQREPVEALRGLWGRVKGSGETAGGHSAVWDLSLNSLTQLLLTVPETDESRETHLSQLNSLILQLQRPQTHSALLPAHNISLQLWRELIDGLVCESVRLRHTLGLEDNSIWRDTTHEQHTLEQRDEEERRAGARPVKDQKRRESIRELEETRGARAAARAAEECGSVKKHMPEERKTDTGEKDSSFTTEHTHSLQQRYRPLLHKQVYVLMERMVDSLCDLLNDSRNPQTTC